MKARRDIKIPTTVKKTFEIEMTSAIHNRVLDTFQYNNSQIMFLLVAKVNTNVIVVPDLVYCGIWVMTVAIQIV